MYQPDSIDAGILPDGSYFVVTANEGDARDDEDVRLEDLETDCPSNDQIVDEDILGAQPAQRRVGRCDGEHWTDARVL
eukprot:1957659-Ditylum_brightwellii.AAC.1